MWKNLEAAALGAPPRMASSFGAGAGVKGVASRAPVSKRTGVPADSGRATEVKSRRIEATLAKRDKENAGKVKATATESKEVLWASTEQRRSEREAWEKKQREREEEVHNVKEKQRKEQAVSCDRRTAEERVADPAFLVCRSGKGSNLRRSEMLS